MPKSIVFCDEHSLDRTVDYLVHFQNGQVGPRYPAPYSTYQQLRNEAIRQQVSAPSSLVAKAGKSEQQKSRPRKLTWNEQRELGQIETRITMLESEKEALELAINDAGSNYTERN